MLLMIEKGIRGGITHAKQRIIISYVFRRKRFA